MFFGLGSILNSQIGFPTRLVLFAGMIFTTQYKSCPREVYNHWILERCATRYTSHPWKCSQLKHSSSYTDLRVAVGDSPSTSKPRSRSLRGFWSLRPTWTRSASPQSCYTAQGKTLSRSPRASHPTRRCNLKWSPPRWVFATEVRWLFWPPLLHECHFVYTSWCIPSLRLFYGTACDQTHRIVATVIWHWNIR